LYHDFNQTRGGRTSRTPPKAGQVSRFEGGEGLLKAITGLRKGRTAGMRARLKKSDCEGYVLRRARELAESGRFSGPQGIEFELRYVEGFELAPRWLSYVPFWGRTRYYLSAGKEEKLPADRDEGQIMRKGFLCFQFI
jgi:hypothetical protein